MFAIWRRWGQNANEFRRARFDLFLQAGRQSAAHHKLPFEPRRQAVPLGQARGQMLGMGVVPIAHLLAIVVTVEMFVPVLVTALVFVATLSVPLALSEGEAARQEERRRGAG